MGCCNYRLIGVALFLLLPTWTNASELLWVTPQWQGYTDVDGSGLYNELIKDIFALNDTSVKQEYRSWKRSLLMVQKHEADMTGGMEKDGDYYFSKYPILSDYEYALFKRASIPQWQGIKSLKNKVGVWVEGYLEGTSEDVGQYLQGFGVSTRVKALEMLLNQNRGVNYLLDNHRQMMETLAQLSEPLDQNIYSIEKVYQADLYMAFQRTPRGLALKQVYDEGFKTLYCKQQLNGYYSKYNFPLPAISIQCSDS